MAITGMEVYIGREIGRQLERNASISGVKVPTRTHARTRQRPGLDVTIPGTDRQAIKPPGRTNVAVSGAGSQGSVHRINVLMPITAPQFHVALEIAEPDVAIAGVQIHPSFAGHVDFNVHATSAQAEADNLARKTHFQLNRVPALMIVDSDAALADLVPLGRHSGLNRVLVPGIHSDVGVRSFHSQVGFS